MPDVADWYNNNENDSDYHRNKRQGKLIRFLAIIAAVRLVVSWALFQTFAFIEKVPRKTWGTRVDITYAR